MTPYSRFIRVVAATGMCGALAGSGCGEPATTVVLINVESRPAVRAAATLQVTVSNDGSDLTETFDIEDVTLPATFTVTPTGREGDLLVSLRAVDEDDVEIATGEGSASIVPDQQVDLAITLEPSDFVVNSSIAGDQSLTFSVDRNSRQIGVAPDDSFVVSFVNDCQNLGRCDVLGRLFDAGSVPVVNDKTRDTTEFIVNQENQLSEVPSVVIGDGSRLFTWASDSQIRSGLMSETGGHLLDADILVSEGVNVTSDPRAAALPTGEFIVVWAEALPDTTMNVRGRFLDRNGQPAMNPITNSTEAFNVTSEPLPFLELPSVVATGDGRSFVVVWSDLDNVRARFFDAAGAPVNAENLTLTPFGTNVLVVAPQVVALGDEIGVVWSALTFDEPPFNDGALAYQRFKLGSGAPVGPEVVLVPTLRTLAEDLQGAAALAARPDGALAASWHDCPPLPGGPEIDGAGCGVLVQVFRESGLSVGEPLIASTTRAADQLLPAIAARSDSFVVAWTDTSAAAPDTDGGSVRARVIYPPFDEPNGVRGHPCGATDDAPCGAGLACIDDADGEQHCHESCDPAASNPCPNGGVCTQQGEVAGCVF